MSADPESWIDVLLEEELGGAGPRSDVRAPLAASEHARVRALERCAVAEAETGPLRGTRVRALAAVLLCALGIGVVVALWLGLPRKSSDEAGRQETQPEILQPASMDELLSLLRDAVAIRVMKQRKLKHEDLESLALSAPGAYLRIAEKGDVAEWVGAMRGILSDPRARGSTWQSEASVELLVELPRNRALLLGCSVKTGTHDVCFGSQPFGRYEGSNAFASTVLAAAPRADLRARLARGVIEDVSDFAELSARVQTLRVPALSAEQIRRHLTRATPILRVYVDSAGAAGREPHGEVVKALAELRDLVELSIDASELDARDLCALAAAPKLTCLELRKSLGEGLAPGFTALVPKLTGLRFVLNAPLPEDVLRMLPDFVRLVELRLSVPGLERLPSGLVRGLTKLACLDLYEASWFRDDQIDELLQNPILQILRLAKTGVTASGVRRLAQIQTLRMLDVSGVAFGPEYAELQGFTQLELLRLSAWPVPVEQLGKAFPRVKTVCDANRPTGGLYVWPPR